MRLCVKPCESSRRPTIRRRRRGVGVRLGGKRGASEIENNNLGHRSQSRSLTRFHLRELIKVVSLRPLSSPPISPPDTPRSGPTLPHVNCTAAEHRLTLTPPAMQS